MKRAIVFAFVLMLLAATLVVGFIGKGAAQETIYIRSDGSVDPSTESIQLVGNTYTFTADIYGYIVVEKDSVVVDGAGYTLRGTGSGLGVNVSSSNVTIKNMQIAHFFRGIYVGVSSNSTISGNTVINNVYGIWVATSNNSITGNYIAGNTEIGIWMQESKNNTIIENYIANNRVGIGFTSYRVTELNNRIYHNSFINNTEHVYQRTQPFPFTLVNIWDNGYPSGGNYWSDYKERYPNAKELNNSGLWDTPYIIAEQVRDNYPLMYNPLPPPSDTTPPAVFVISPENKSYATSNVSLTFTVNETALRMAYSLDGKANVAITGNTTLTELSEGSHSIVVYASDAFGNTGASSPVYFAIDMSAPRISILVPENKTYDATDVPLTFTVNEPLSWITYSLDGKDNVTIVGNVTLAVLPEGSHNVVVYAADTAGNAGASEKVYFTIQPFPIIWVAAAIAIAAIGAAGLYYFAKIKKRKKS